MLDVRSSRLSDAVGQAAAVFVGFVLVVDAKSAVVPKAAVESVVDLGKRIDR